jgi:Protein of unknown function (DUF2845)
MADADPVAPWMRPGSKNINIGGGDTAVTEMSLPPPQAKLSSSVPTHGSTILIKVKIGIRGPSPSRRLIVAALFAGLAVSTVRADTFRCGTHLVRPGDTSFEVLKKCGRPASQQQISGANERFVEQWYYEPGPTAFQRILTFVGTRLVDIEIVTRP